MLLIYFQKNNFADSNVIDRNSCVMKKVVVWSLFLVLALSCTKDNEEIIPNVRFSATVELSLLPDISHFIVKPGGLNPIVGINGITVYRVSSDQYNAFDLMCPHEHDKPGYFFTEVEDKGSGYMVCPECGTKFEVISEFGGVVEGPSKWPLKRYQTILSGTTLRIWN